MSSKWDAHFKAANLPRMNPGRRGCTGIITSNTPDATFGAEYDLTTTKGVQQALTALATALNKPAFNPKGADGIIGPNTRAAISAFQSYANLPATGTADSATQDAIQTALNKAPAPKAPKGGGAAGTGAKGTSAPTNIATVAAAIKQAAKEMGYTPDTQLIKLMIGQWRGAEGAYPGIQGSTLSGTNNIGAAQVTKTLATDKASASGWGAFAHYDSSPGRGGYIGWYWIAPSPLEAARYWLGGNWWGKRLLEANPQTPTDYATILYNGGYFEGSTPHDQPGAAEANINAYAANIQRGMPSDNELAAPITDPSAFTVDPTKFAALPARKITEALFNQAEAGGLGGSWKFLLPASFVLLTKSNGVVFFNPKEQALWLAGQVPWGPQKITLKKGLIAGGIAGGILALTKWIGWW